MPLITPDFSDVKDSISPGEYKARIVEHQIGEWQNGNKFIKWVMETCGETEAKNNGRRLYHTTPISGGGVFKLQDLYRAAMQQPLPTNEGFDTEMLLGKELKVVVVDGVNYKTGEPTGYPEVKKTVAL